MDSKQPKLLVQMHNKLRLARYSIGVSDQFMNRLPMAKIPPIGVACTDAGEGRAQDAESFACTDAESFVKLVGSATIGGVYAGLIYRG